MTKSNKIEKMIFCVICPLRITKGKQPVIYPYHMEGQVLESVNNNPYLGVELSSTLSWDTHIGNILTKANRSLRFIRRNVPQISSDKPTSAL